MINVIILPAIQIKFRRRQPEFLAAGLFTFGKYTAIRAK